MSHFRSSGSATAESIVTNLGVRGVMTTGICFLDHMIDQLTSHAQLGVTLRITLTGDSPVTCEPHTDYAGGSLMSRPHDRDIFASAGAALGASLRALVEQCRAEADPAAAGQTCKAIFCCPLDEAFAEACLDLTPGAATSSEINLAPYGSIPVGGRRWIGCYRCELTPVFFSSLSDELGACLKLRKVRGNNAHHIVESTFKAFSRVLRACLDELVDWKTHGCVSVKQSENRVARPLAATATPTDTANRPVRNSSRKRCTKETSIEVRVNLDASSPLNAASNSKASSQICTGVVLLDQILAELRTASGFDIMVVCKGDTYIDDHHTAEDVAIALGQCLHSALGSKAGLTRMGCAVGESAGSSVRAILDLSNRPFFEENLNLDEEFVGGDEAASSARLTCLNDHDNEDQKQLCGRALSCEMLHHVFDSLTLETRATAHLEVLSDTDTQGHTLHQAIAAARAQAFF